MTKEQAVELCKQIWGTSSLLDLSDDDQRDIANIVQRIAKANEKPGRAHWLFGSGSKPLGEDDHGMKFDDEILYFETAERAAYPSEEPQ